MPSYDADLPGSLWPAAVLRLLALFFVLVPGCALAQASWPPRWSFAEGWELSTSASVQYQALHAETDDADARNLDGFRRQRAALTLKAPAGYVIKLDYDFASGTWADAVVQIALGERQGLRVGQVKTPIGLEVFGSHRSLATFERAAMSTLLPGRRLGVEWSRRVDNGHLTVTAIGDNLDDQAHGHGLFARGTRRFGASTDTGQWHLGLGAGLEWPEGDLRLRGRPDVSGLPLTVADSGTLNTIERIGRVALETAWDRGPWTVQAEYARLRADRGSAGSGIDGDGAYLMASWRVTGESRGYRDGLFESPRPARPQGALELVARVSYLAVDTAAGGRQSGHSVSIGGNWYINRYWRIQAQASDSPDDDAGRIYGLRLHHLF